MISRRSFFTGAAATLITAPAIVRVESLMPMKKIPMMADYQALFNAILAENMKKLNRATAEAIMYGRSTVYYGNGYGETFFAQPIQERYGLISSLLDKGQLNATPQGFQPFRRLI